MSRASATWPTLKWRPPKAKVRPIAHAFANELKTKTVGQIIEQVDSYYKENPGKLGTTVLEVILIRCTKGVCPPGLTK